MKFIPGSGAGRGGKEDILKKAEEKREEEETGLEKEYWLMMAVVQHFEYQLLLTIIRKTESLLSRVWKGLAEAFSHSDVVFVSWTMAENFDPKKRVLLPCVNGRLKLRGCLPAQDKGNLVQMRGGGHEKNDYIDILKKSSPCLDLFRSPSCLPARKSNCSTE